MTFEANLPDPAFWQNRFSWNTGFHPYRIPPLLFAKLPDDNERPRRYSGNSHQRRKQRRAKMPPRHRTLGRLSLKDGNWR